MPRIRVILAALGIMGAVFVAGAACFLWDEFQPLVPRWINGSRPCTAQDARKMPDEELVRAIAAGDTAWTVPELKARCTTYSPAQLEAVVATVVDAAFPLEIGHLEVHPFFTAIRDFLPPPYSDQAAARAGQKRREVYTALDTYVQSQNSASASHTPEDIENLYQISADLADKTKYPQVAAQGCFGSERDWIRSRALQALTYCGPAGLARIRELGEAGSVLAWALARTGTPDNITELVGLCQQAPVSKDLLTSLSALAGLKPGLRTPETRDTLRSRLPEFLHSPEPVTRAMAASVAGSSGDPGFLPMLEDLAANDPHHETDERSRDAGVSVHQFFERYRVRENAALAVEKIRMADPAFRATREAEDARIRRLMEIPGLETNAVALRRDAMQAMHDAQPAKQEGDALAMASWKTRLADLSRMRDDNLVKLAGLRKERAQVLNEPDLEWNKTELELLATIANGSEGPIETLKARCAVYPEQWLEQTALLALDAEEQADSAAAQRLAEASAVIFPARIHGPVAEYRLARDGDDAAKALFAAKVSAGMTTGYLTVALLHRLCLRIDNRSLPSDAVLIGAFRKAVLTHGRDALFLAPAFLDAPDPVTQTPEGSISDGLPEVQKSKVLGFQKLRAKVCQIDYNLADVTTPAWVVSAIKDQRNEARQQMDALWQELASAAHTATAPKTGPSPTPAR